MTNVELSALAGILLSLIMSYVPGLSTWFASKNSQTKSLVMAVLLLVVAAGALLYKCNLGSECITNNWHDYAVALFAALIANQSAYTLSPTSQAVKDVKAAKDIPALDETPGPDAKTPEAPKETTK